MDLYETPQPSLWTGRDDNGNAERFFQRVQCVDLNNQTSALTENAFALLGFASDTGVQLNLGRAGAKEGPNALRQCLGKLALSLPPSQQVYDVGNIICKNDLEKSQQHLSNTVAQLLEKKIKPVLFGGGHEIAWGHYQGIRQHYSNTKIGVINFDAHLDMRALLPDGRGHSGSPFLQIANDCQQRQQDFSYLCLGVQPSSNTATLFKTAESLNTKIVFAKDLINPLLTSENNQIIHAFIQAQDIIYLTVCLDAFAVSVAPGVSAPQVCGIYPFHFFPFFQTILATKKVVSFDIAELSPPHDCNNITAKLAAEIALTYMTYQ